MSIGFAVSFDHRGAHAQQNTEKSQPVPINVFLRRALRAYGACYVRGLSGAELRAHAYEAGSLSLEPLSQF